jgi:methyl-accepting chemotaxis protein
MKTLQSKLAVIFGIFLALGVVGIVIALLNSQKDDAAVINLMGMVVTLRWFNIILLSIMVITVVLTWFVIVQPLIKTFRGIVDNLSNGAEQVASATEQISALSQSLAQGSSGQASSIEETLALMEEMASMTKQNANNANETVRLVDMCSVSAENGNKVVKEMSRSMEEINESSKKIAEITKVIEGIAFQTNLLALNDVVEAARAGETWEGICSGGRRG